MHIYISHQKDILLYQLLLCMWSLAEAQMMNSTSLLIYISSEVEFIICASAKDHEHIPPWRLSVCISVCLSLVILCRVIVYLPILVLI